MQTSVPFRASLGIVAFAGAAIAGLAATHPARAASVLASVTSAVSCATTTACVSGTNTSNGPGVEGTSKSSYGVEGVSTSNDGLKGISSTSNGISGSSTSSKTTAFGVKGESPYIGVFGESSKGGGVYGEAPAFGVMGIETSTGSSFAAGVVGLTPSGNTDAIGVYGVSNEAGPIEGSSTGVEGQTKDGYGVVGTASGDGAGVEGDSFDYYGVLGNSYNEVGGDFTGGSYGVIADSTNVPIASGKGGENSFTFQVDAAGDITYAGSLNSVSSATNGVKVRTFGPRSAAPTVEDSGSAQLVAGAATVRLDPTFASSIDPHVAYRVFLTPDGDTRGLFVATKTPAGFVVRETQGGRSTLAFDYRIIATTLGAAGQRMSVATDSMLGHLDKAMLPKLHARPPGRAGSLQTPFFIP